MYKSRTTNLCTEVKTNTLHTLCYLTFTFVALIYGLVAILVYPTPCLYNLDKHYRNTHEKIRPGPINCYSKMVVFRTASQRAAPCARNNSMVLSLFL